VLFAADASYKFAYSTVLNALAFERDNRETIKAIAPQVKPALDKVRETTWEIDQKWARARSAYKANPTPAGLTTLETILAEIEKLMPIVTVALEPYIGKLTATP